MKKRILSIALALVLALTVAAGAAAADYVVQRSPQTLKFNGSVVSCEKYNIDGYNYFKLRDLAAILSGTRGQFEVGWDEARGVVTITPGQPYTARDGTELVIGEDKSATAVPSPQTVMVNGTVRSDFSVFNIGGNNYFKLRDLATVLDVTVDYDEPSNTAILLSGALHPASWSDLPQPEEGLKMWVASTNCTVGGTITVYWSGVSEALRADGAWIGLARYGMSADEYVDYHYIEGEAGTVNFTAPGTAGFYQVRFYRAGYTGDDSLMKDMTLLIDVA